MSTSRVSRSSVGPTTDPIPPLRGGPTRAAQVSVRGPPPPSSPRIRGRDGAIDGESSRCVLRTTSPRRPARAPRVNGARAVAWRNGSVQQTRRTCGRASRSPEHGGGNSPRQDRLCSLNHSPNAFNRGTTSRCRITRRDAAGGTRSCARRSDRPWLSRTDPQGIAPILLGRSSGGSTSPPYNHLTQTPTKDSAGARSVISL
jgi:hypothetical protein